jgi:hypothetical protein
MSEALNVMKRARENEYFIKEQEREIAEYIAKLKSEGRYEEAMRRASNSSSSSSSSGALPQVLAHSVRLFDKKIYDEGRGKLQEAGSRFYQEAFDFGSVHGESGVYWTRNARFESVFGKVQMERVDGCSGRRFDFLGA